MKKRKENYGVLFSAGEITKKTLSYFNYFQYPLERFTNATLAPELTENSVSTLKYFTQSARKRNIPKNP